MSDAQGPNMSRAWSLEFGNRLLAIVREEREKEIMGLSGHDELEVAFRGELPTRKAADYYRCSCGDWLSAGMSAHDSQEHLQARHGERPYRPEPENYVTPYEEIRKETPGYTVLEDEICPRHGGRNLIVQYNTRTDPTIIDNCEGCAGEE